MLHKEEERNSSKTPSVPPRLTEGVRPPILPPTLPPSVQERTVVPPILTQKEKEQLSERQNPNGSNKKAKKSFAELVYLFFVWLSKENVVGTWISFAFHFFLLMLLALVVHQAPRMPQSLLVGGFSKFDDGLLDGNAPNIDLEHAISSDPSDAESDPVLDSQTDVDNIETPIEEINPTSTQAASNQGSQEQEIEKIKPVEPGPQDSQPGESEHPNETDQDGTGVESQEQLAKSFASGGGFELRNDEGRGKRGGPGDPTQESELAVDMGLHWLTQHQDVDGGWSFNLGRCGRARHCSHPGTHASRTAATGIALLPFLGAGHTHLQGEHKKVVERGLRFLLNPKNATEMSIGYNLTQQTTQGMYAQGIATIALCEAYGMTRGKAKNRRAREFEEKLHDAAQNAVYYIENAQDLQKRYIGGWRYRINQSPGDLSVTGWQILALKSAMLSGIEVKSSTLSRAELFLNSTQYDEGRRFNYLPLKFPYNGKFKDGESIGLHPNSEFTCTAIGLLMRMYFGTAPGFTPLDEGIGYLDRWGPFKSETQAARSGRGECNLYYAYYGTLALHHYGGSAWNRWFPELREFLIHTQEKSGHEVGSWFFSDPYCDVGGRLLNTSLAIMILEVRYRYMSLYDVK